MSDHPKLKELLDSVNLDLDDLFEDNKEDENKEK